MSVVSRIRIGVLAAVICLLAAQCFAQPSESDDDDTPPAPPRTMSDVMRAQFRAAIEGEPSEELQPIPDQAIRGSGPVSADAQPGIWAGSTGLGAQPGPLNYEQAPFGRPRAGCYDDSCYMDPAHQFFGGLRATPGHFAQHGWVRMEYLGWFVNGMHVPPLVTTSPAGTPQAAAGVIGDPGTSTLFGASSLLTGLRSGGRLRFGTWLDSCDTIGIEAEYFSLAQAVQTYSASSDGTGNPILARPFFNIAPITPGVAPANDSELVSYPGVLAGTVNVRATSRLDGAGLRMMFRGCCSQWCQPGDCEVPVLNRSVQTNFFAGYRYLRLGEGLQISENLTSLLPANPGTFGIFDQFNTENTFSGLDLGGIYTFQQNRWSLEVMSRLALGGTRQEVHINGATTVNTGGATATLPGGLLTQSSNIGGWARDVFSFVPEIDLTLGYQLLPRLRLVGGYTLLAWTGVARPGDQIDTAVNPTLIPFSGAAVNGPLRPEFNYHSTTLVVQGFNFGLDSRW